MIEHFELGDTVRMKKSHACGADTWTITRVGADVKIRCLGCGREVMGPRSKFEKNIRQVQKEIV